MNGGRAPSALSRSALRSTAKRRPVLLLRKTWDDMIKKLLSSQRKRKDGCFADGVSENRPCLPAR